MNTCLRRSDPAPVCSTCHGIDQHGCTCDNTLPGRLLAGWQQTVLMRIKPAAAAVVGSADTIDQNVGKHYRRWMHPYKGSYGKGSADGLNHFWPVPGNHDWGNECNSSDASLRPYLDYMPVKRQRYYQQDIGGCTGRSMRQVQMHYRL